MVTDEILMKISRIDTFESLTNSCLLEELVKKFGTTASISCFDAAYLFFFQDGIEGCIGYRIENRCAIVMGDPLCDEKQIFELTKAFIKHCKNKGMPVIFISASKNFTQLVTPLLCASALSVADDLIFDPKQDPKKGSKGRLLRGKVSQAKRFGVRAEEYVGYCPKKEEEMDMVAREWLSNRQGPQIFLAPIDLFCRRNGRRYIYACLNGVIIGVCLLQQLDSKKGWLLQWLLTSPQAPNGTSELLVDSAITILREESCRVLYFGACQKKEIGMISGLGPLSTLIAKIGYKTAKKLLPLEGRRAFWKKFNPEAEDLFLIFEKKTISFKEINAIMKALHVSF